MMFEVVEARRHMLGKIARQLRVEHHRSVVQLGLDAHRELSNTFTQSHLRRAALLDGRLAALWGVTGSALSPFGFGWLCLTDEATRHPTALLREIRRQFDYIMQTKTRLVTTVLADDEAALRLSSWLGFHVGHDGLGAPAVSKWGRKVQMEYIRRSPHVRIPQGAGYGIAMGVEQKAVPC